MDLNRLMRRIGAEPSRSSVFIGVLTVHLVLFLLVIQPQARLTPPSAAGGKETAGTVPATTSPSDVAAQAEKALEQDAAKSAPQKPEPKPRATPPAAPESKPSQSPQRPQPTQDKAGKQTPKSHVEPAPVRVSPPAPAPKPAPAEKRPDPAPREGAAPSPQTERIGPSAERFRHLKPLPAPSES